MFYNWLQNRVVASENIILGLELEKGYEVKDDGVALFGLTLPFTYNTTAYFQKIKY